MFRSSSPEIRRMLVGGLLCALVISACSSHVLAPQAQPPTTTTTSHRVPATFDATGREDVSAKLQAWLDALPDSSRIIGPAGARYRVEFGVMVEKRQGFLFDAEDAKRPPALLQTQLEPYGVGHPDNRNRMVLGFRYGGGHTVRNWILKGAHKNSGYDGQFIAALESQHGLLISGVDGLLVEDVFITEVGGDFIYLTNRFGNGVNHLSRDVTIRRVKGRKNGRQGVAVTGGVNVLIEQSDFQDIKRSAFDIEPNGERGSVQNLLVRKNIFGSFRNAWVAGHGASAAAVHDITFEDNEVIGRPLVFQLRGWRTTSLKPDGKRRGNIRIANNRAHSIASIATGGLTVMEFSALDNVEVVGNVVEFTGQKPIGVGAYFNETCGIVYSGNKWGNAEYDHKVTIGYDAAGSPLTQYDVRSLEWPLCPKSTP